ncbi:uncharacterized protein LOC133265495 isoform X2 [Pezoporus flaviventris]|nr:uncharacterized protein LOC133265495 isoform X2 [Pezoporus flaviventris]
MVHQRYVCPAFCALGPGCEHCHHLNTGHCWLQVASASCSRLVLSSCCRCPVPPPLPTFLERRPLLGFVLQVALGLRKAFGSPGLLRKPLLLWKDARGGGRAPCTAVSAWQREGAAQPLSYLAEQGWLSGMCDAQHS